MTKKKKTNRVDKSTKKKKSRKKTSRIYSERRAATLIKAQTENIHFFDNYGMIEARNAIKYQEEIINRAEKQLSLAIFSVLKKSLPERHVKEFEGNCWRIVPKGQKNNALDTKNTYGAGGRVNIGMAQIDVDFNGINATEGIYCSQTFLTAEKEYNSGGPLGKFEKVELRIKKTRFIMIDFDKVVQGIEQLFPAQSLSAKVSASPYGARWVLQKFPVSSQIIGHWLRQHFEETCDGIFFSSTKDVGGINFFVFSPLDWEII